MVRGLLSFSAWATPRAWSQYPMGASHLPFRPGAKLQSEAHEAGVLLQLLSLSCQIALGSFSHCFLFTKKSGYIAFSEGRQSSEHHAGTSQRSSLSEEAPLWGEDAGLWMLVVPGVFLQLSQQPCGLYQILTPTFFKLGSHQTSIGPLFVPVDAPWLRGGTALTYKSVGGSGRPECHDGLLTLRGHQGSRIRKCYVMYILTQFFFKHKSIVTVIMPHRVIVRIKWD